MEFIIQFIVALFATLSFAVIFFRSKKGAVFTAVFTGALGWIIYYIMVQFDMGVVFPSLYRDTVPYDNGAHFCCGTLYACDSLSAFRYLSSLCREQEFFTRHIYLFTNDRALFLLKRVLKPLRWRVPSLLGIIFGFGIPQSLFNLLKPKKKTELLELCQICNFLRQILEILPTLHFLHQLPLEVFLFFCEFV